MELLILLPLCIEGLDGNKLLTINRWGVSFPTVLLVSLQ